MNFLGAVREQKSKSKSPSPNLEAGKHHKESQRKLIPGAEIPGTINW